uniref:Uncharacterized protein n=1 Tax=Siphoviridae sp. ctBCr48 TaxID=2827802 RepID=A0A8S5SIM8_9CAUD|nr:MAG TPA: hypothetical protein [Siphoviridae sp. ctBCr48]
MRYAYVRMWETVKNGKDGIWAKALSAIEW